MLKLRDICWELGGRTYVMGILNVTPDSFSDGGRHFAAEAAISAAREMMEQGADIIDIGGQSTRPGSEEISADEEWGRIWAVAEALGKEGIPFSVDTFYPTVAAKALSAGAVMINDVSGEVSPHMAEVVKNFGAAWVLMSRKDSADSVKADLENMAAEAMKLGVDRRCICLDPGIGFGKDNEQSLDIIRRTAEIKPEGFAYLMAASRKRCIGYMSGIEAPEERDEATAVAHGWAISGGADIIRVHNVALAASRAKEDDKKFRS